MDGLVQTDEVLQAGSISLSRDLSKYRPFGQGDQMNSCINNLLCLVAVQNEWYLSMYIYIQAHYIQSCVKRSVFNSSQNIVQSRVYRKWV